MPPLPGLLRANAASCLGFGALFVIAPDAVARFLSEDPAPPALMRALGALLLVNGAHLLRAARRPRPWLAEIVYFAAGDLLWVIGTLALALAGLWITTAPGLAAALGVAALVGRFGLLQARAARALARAAPAP